MKWLGSAPRETAGKGERLESRDGRGWKGLTELLPQVERYVGHVRGLSRERDAAIAECERENERLGTELARLRLQHGNPALRGRGAGNFPAGLCETGDVWA